MKKKISLFLLVIILLASGVGAYLIFHQEKKGASTQLSEETKAYLAAKQKTGNDPLRNVNTNPEAVEGNSSITIGNCFSFFIPYKISSRRVDGECQEYIMTRTPRGSMVVYQKKDPVSSIDGVPGVSMRKLDKVKYEQETKVIKGKEFLAFRSTEDTRETTVFYAGGRFYWVMSLLISPEEKIITPDIEKMLSSLTFL